MYGFAAKPKPELYSERMRTHEGASADEIIVVKKAY